MADVTDISFRTLIARLGKPDVMWTEFVSADGLMLAPEEAKEKLLKDLKFNEEERPIVAQLFGSNPKTMEEAAKLCQDLGFDGIDINMGCPDRSIEKQGAGSAMIKNPKTAEEIIKAAKRGAPNLPISVKTRIGYNKLDELEDWISFLLKQDIPTLTVHLRTRKEMSKVPAHWELASKVVELRDKISPKTLIIGNGDVLSPADALEKIKETGIDGVMIGRGIFGNPWRFNREIERDTDISIKERLETLIEHSKIFEKELSHKNFAVMKKHFKAYVEGFNGAKELRVKLMEINTAKDVERIINDWLKEEGF